MPHAHGCEPRFFSRGRRKPQDRARRLQYESIRPENHVDQTVFSADLQGNTAPDTERLFQREPYIQYLVLALPAYAPPKNCLHPGRGFFRIRNRNIRML